MNHKNIAWLIFCIAIVCLGINTTIDNYISSSKTVTVENHSFTSVIWDTSKTPWKSMPNCALSPEDYNGWCDDFSNENHILMRKVIDGNVIEN